MRHALILSLLFACSCGGGGGCPFPEYEERIFCQSVEFPTGDVLPEFSFVRECGHAIMRDEYGFTEEGERAAEDWVSAYVGNGGGGPVEEGGVCGTIVEPGDLLGRRVMDYGTGEFVLLETEADVDAFLAR